MCQFPTWPDRVASSARRWWCADSFHRSCGILGGLAGSRPHLLSRVQPECHAVSTRRQEPMPESCNSWGDWMAPADGRTSSGFGNFVRPLAWHRAPTARLPSITTPMACAPVSIHEVGAILVGCEVTWPVLQRQPFPGGQLVVAAFLALTVKSSVRGTPFSPAPLMKASINGFLTPMSRLTAGQCHH